MAQTYLNPRLSAKLAEIPLRKLTVAVAPMGYGKSTAIDHFLESVSENDLIFRQHILVTEFELFWRDLNYQLEKYTGEPYDLPLPDDEYRLVEIFDRVRRLFIDGKRAFWVIEDVHLINDERFREFLIRAVEMLPDELRIILIGRHLPLNNRDLMKLGRYMNEIELADLRLEEDELVEYAHCLGLKVSSSEARAIWEYTEGWFAAIYLIFRMKAAGHENYLQLESVYQMIDEMFICELPAEQVIQLALLSELPFFDEELLNSVFGPQGSESLLALFPTNAFIHREAAGFRMHQLMKKQLMEQAAVPPEERQDFYKKIVNHYIQRGDLPLALQWSVACCDSEGFFEAMTIDQGLHVNGQNFQEIAAFALSLSEKEVQRYPYAYLVILFAAFAENKMSVYFEIKERITENLRPSAEFPKEEYENILGDIAVIDGFLYFNSIRDMGQSFRAARQLLHRNTLAIHPSMPWTFGSPSVLALYHQKPEALMQEEADLREYMPDYHWIAGNHGAGAAEAFCGERLFLQGAFSESMLQFYLAEKKAVETCDNSILLCIYFHRMRKNLLDKDQGQMEENLAKITAIIEAGASEELADTLVFMQGYLYAQQGKIELVPDWLLDQKRYFQRLSEICGSIYPIIHGAVHLSTGNVYEVIAREQDDRMKTYIQSSVIAQLYYSIQQAAAWWQLKDEAQAIKNLRLAFDIAEQNRFVVPFVEYYPQIAPLLVSPKLKGDQELVRQIKAMSNDQGGAEEGAVDLTALEEQIVQLLREKRSNQEIASELAYSEGTIKQYLNKIYAKMAIPGDQRNKRSLLIHQLEKNS